MMPPQGTNPTNHNNNSSNSDSASTFDNSSRSQDDDSSSVKATMEGARFSFETSSGEKIPQTSVPSLITDKELFECDSLQLHLIGHIQGNTGHVIFVRFPLGQVVAVDANIRNLEWIQAPNGASADDDDNGPHAMLGASLSAWVSNKPMLQTIMRVVYASQRNSLPRSFHFEQGYALTVAMASTDASVFAIEIEQAHGQEVLDNYSDTLTYISKLVDFYANESIVNMACHTMFEILPEYDRGMVYRFNDDMSGEIIHELRRGDLPTSYLGHRFPKYDIPLSSRQLYIQNKLRYIQSSTTADVPIVSLHNQPVDLTHIRSRSVARPHLIYMQNMGVQCSMSMAIIVENELWGLFAFHGYHKPYRPSLHQRIACEAITSMVSVRVESLVRKAASARIVSLGECMQRWSASKRFHANIQALGDEILGIVEADVLVAFEDNETVVIGDGTLAPSFSFWKKARELTANEELLTVCTRQELATKGFSQEDCPASGFAYFISEGETQLFLGRADRTKDVRWAGNPDQPKIRGLDGVLNPRNSFNIFMEKARKECKAWSMSDLNVLTVLKDRVCTGQAHEWMTALLKSDIEEANMRYFSLLDRERDNSQFFAHMCHELRTPFHGIMGCLNLIHDSLDTMSRDEIQDLVKTGLGAGNHMINLLNDILNQSKNKYLSNQPVRHTLRFDSLMQEVGAPFKVLARNLHVDFRFDYTNEENYVFALDRTKFIQISTNVINNAMKFAKNGKVRGSATVVPTLQDSIEMMKEWVERFDGFVFSIKGGKMVTCFDDARAYTEELRNKEDEHWLCFTVSDYGSGMEPNELAEMFEPYTRGGSNSNDSVFQGTGLGFYISVSLCHQLGGYIACLSTPNVGTTFHIGIPVEVISGSDAPGSSEEEDNKEKVHPKEGTIPLHGPILIVDDNKVNLKLLRLHLTKELKKAKKHVDVISAESGEVAFEKYKNSLPSIVIIDYHMPGMNGLEATTAIRTYERMHLLQPSFILSYTADLSAEACNLLVSSGSDGIMTKPPPKDFLQNLVGRMEMGKKTKIMEEYKGCVDCGETESGSGGDLG